MLSLHPKPKNVFWDVDAPIAMVFNIHIALRGTASGRIPLFLLNSFGMAVPDETMTGRL